MAMRPNRSSSAPAGAELFQKIHATRQAQKRAGELAIAAAHGRQPGPQITSTTEAQPQPKQPRLQVR